MVSITENDSGSEYFGYRFYSNSYRELIDELICRVKSGDRKLVVATPNSDFIVRAKNDPGFKALLAKFDYLLPDGYPIQAISFIANRISEKFQRLHRITGADLTRDLSLAAVNGGFKVLFFGGAPGVADEAARRISSERCDCVYSFCPEYGFTENEIINERYLNIVNEIAPDFIFVALGSPKQEAWIDKHRSSLDFGVAIGVGASLDFISGKYKRAPDVFQKLGLEWVYRMIQEPKRLGRRYIKLIIPFAMIFYREVLKKYETR